MADPNEAKAQKLLQEAEKKGKSGGGLFGLFGGGKGEEACELYVKAGNLFKMAKKWHEAGNCFVKSAELQLKQNDAKHEAASNYADAATCFRKVNAQHAADCLQKAAEIYTDMGRFTMAAKQHNSIAELYETEAPDLEKAMYHYEKAGDYYKGEESKSAANKCFLKVAQFAASLEQYRRAIDIYEEVAISSADNTLLRYSAKDYFFKAALCHLCQDVLDAQHAITRYDELHPAFADSREHKLLKDVILAVEEKNLDAFTAAVKDYEKISRLDDWTVTMLLRVKKQCGDGEGGGGGSDLL